MESGIYPKLYFAGEARGKAHVHVVIIGFAACDRAEKQIYDYDADGSHVTVTPAKNISPILSKEMVLPSPRGQLQSARYRQ